MLVTKLYLGSYFTLPVLKSLGKLNNSSRLTHKLDSFKSKIGSENATQWLNRSPYRVNLKGDRKHPIESNYSFTLFKDI